MSNQNSSTFEKIFSIGVAGAALFGAAYLLQRNLNQESASSHTIDQSNRTEKYRSLYLEPMRPNMQFTDSLSNDVWSMYISSKENLSDYNEKLKVWSHLIDIMDEPNLEIFGSSITGFALKTSDLDICIPVSRPLNRYDSYNKLSNHYEMLIKKSGNFTSVYTVNATIPIIKSEHHTNILVDISYKEPYCPSTNLLRMYSMVDWRVAPLVVIVKLWSHRNNINGAVNGFLSSYALTLMVISFLQSKNVVPFLRESHHDQLCSNVDLSTSIFSNFRSTSTDTLGVLFLEFFDCYSTFDFDSCAISIRNASIERKPWGSSCIFIENPFDRYKNNVAAAIKPENFSRIKNVLESSYAKLSLTEIRTKNYLEFRTILFSVLKTR